MNDLAEKALHGLGAAGRAVTAHPMLSFAVLGFAVSSVVTGAGGEVGAARASRPLSTWLGLEDTHGARAGNWIPGSILVAAIAVLVLLWIVVVEFVRRSGQPERRVWWVAAAWATPFAVGPPLLGTTAYSYAAFGLLQRHGLSPYDFGANKLTGDTVVAAIEPSSRGTPSGVGPLGTLVQHLAVSISSGSALGAVIVLRILAVVVTVVIGRLAAELAGRHRDRALTLTVLNPLVLLYLVSAARLDGLMVAFALAALVAAQQRRWLVSIALACLAGSVIGVGFILVPVIIAAHWLGRRSVAWWRLVGRDILVAVGTTAVAGLVVTDGFGWLWTVSKQFSAHTPFSFSGAIAKALSPVVRGASYDDLAAGARITVLTAMVCVVVYLVATTRQRALERTAGYSLLAIALLAPVLYPWYLLWGVLCLAPTVSGARRVVLIALSAAGCLLYPPGFSPTTMNVITGAALVAVAAATGAVFVVGRRSSAPAEPVSAGS